MKFHQQLWHQVVIFFFWFISLLPKFIQCFIGNIVFVLIAYVIQYRKKTIISNLKNSFPNKNPKEISGIIKGYYHHMAYMMIENMILRHVVDKEVINQLAFQNAGLVEKFRNENRSIILVLGHLGNWEHGSVISKKFSYKGTAIYKKLTSPVFDRIYFDLRSNLGVIPVEMHNVLRQVVELRKMDEPFILFSVADQSPTFSEINYWLSFLNQDTGVFMGPEKISVKFDMPIIYCEIIRTGFNRFNVNFELISDKPKETKEHEIINKFYRLLESSINKYPENWLWSHRRWKHKKP